MLRTTITRILDDLDGVSRKGDEFQTAEGHRLTFYLGQPGRAMVVTRVSGGKFHEEYLVLRSGEPPANLYVAYEDVCVVAERPPEDARERRAGFSTEP